MYFLQVAGWKFEFLRSPSTLGSLHIALWLAYVTLQLTNISSGCLQLAFALGFILLQFESIGHFNLQPAKNLLSLRDRSMTKYGTSAF